MMPKKQTNQLLLPQSGHLIWGTAGAVMMNRVARSQEMEQRRLNDMAKKDTYQLNIEIAQ